MKERYDVVVVGSGAAGLTAAAYSTKAGLRTLVCERWHKTGGLVESFVHEGFTFDAGIRAFEDSGVITPMLRSLGIEMAFVKNPVSIGIGESWVQLNGEESLVPYADLYKSIFPAHADEIDAIMREIVKVMRYMDVLYGVENPLFLENELKDPQYLTKTLLPWLIRYNSNIKKAGRLNEPVREYLKKFTTSQELIDMICQHFFAETPTFFALSYFGLYLDYRYPVGGTAVLPQKLTEYITSHGGEVLLKAEVVRISKDQQTIELADGRMFEYGQLIWAGDQTALYRALGDSLPEKAQKQKALVEKSHGIDSIMTLFIGSTIPPEEAAQICGAHAFYTPKTTGLSTLPDWHSLKNGGIDALMQWVVDYLENTTYEISIPVLRDGSLAPEGKTGLVVSTLFDYDLSLYLREAGDYEAFKSLVTKTILRVLSESALPGLSERVERVLCSTPLTIERETASRHGAITGWAHTNHPMPAESRFPKIKNAVLTPVQNVLQCGMWTFSPAGLPVSIITGKLAADEAVRRLKKRK